MDNDLSIDVRAYNERVRVMNQSQASKLVMTAQEARNLHSDIFALLAKFAELSAKPQVEPEVANFDMDGGGF